MVAKEENMTVAAARMFISQSSLSLRIKTLEKELGCQLLFRNRGGHEIRLTEKGEAFLELALQYQEITEKMLAIGQNQQKMLRIGAVNSISSSLLPDVCELFMRTHPDVRLEVHDFEKTSEICSWLEHGQLDLALTGGSTYKRKVKTEPFFRESMVFICHREAEINSNVKLSELDYTKEIYSNWFTDYIDWHERKFAFGKQPAIFVSNMTQLTRFLNQSERWAIVPASVAHNLISSNQNLIVLETEFEIPKRLTNLLSQAKGILQPYQKDFLDTFREYVTKIYGNRVEWY